LKVIHANDAKKALGSRVDRHEHIGEGEIGLEPFRWLVNDSRMAHVPIVVETPDAETMHQVNVAALRKLTAGKNAQ
jgi:deoxyribonuclease-4